MGGIHSTCRTCTNFCIFFVEHLKKREKLEELLVLAFGVCSAPLGLYHSGILILAITILVEAPKCAQNNGSHYMQVSVYMYCSCKKTLKEVTMCMNGTSSLCLLKSPLVLSPVLPSQGRI